MYFSVYDSEASHNRMGEEGGGVGAEVMENLVSKENLLNNKEWNEKFNYTQILLIFNMLIFGRLQDTIWSNLSKM